MARPGSQLDASDAIDRDEPPGEESSLLGRLRERLPVGVPQTRSQLAVMVALSTPLALGLAWYGLREEAPSSEARLEQALRLLDERGSRVAWEQARDIAASLESLDFRPPDFAGAVEFILGVAAFRDAQDRDEVVRERQYRRAVRYLREAEGRALDAARIPEWSFALGSSLHALGESAEARPLLEQALKSWPEERAAAAVRLIDVALDLREPDLLAQALELSTELISESQGTDRDWLQRAHILRGLGRTAEAEEVLGRLSRKAAADHATQVLRAQLLMDRSDWPAALELLEPTAGNVGLERTAARQATYLMGVCASALGDIDAALDHYDRTARRYSGSHEALAALLHTGDLLRHVGRNEEALDAYRQALRTVRRPEEFRNRWLSLAEFREAVLEAWNAWTADHSYPEAIGLAREMTPLLSTVQAKELEARARQLRAEHARRAMQDAPAARRAALRDGVCGLWRESGRAWDEYAQLLKTSAGYSDALWHSADHYRRARDFDAALEQLTRFIETRPRNLLPLALVRRGETLMDLDRLDEALEHFREVARTWPTDPAAFEAEFLIGACHLERDEPQLAEKAWQGMLSFSELTPAATEWRLALFSLGRLQAQTAATLKSRAARRAARDGAGSDEAQRLISEGQQRSEEAVRLLDEFLDRYPQAPQALEARYLLARALRQSADAPRSRLNLAETENARAELRRTYRTLLDRARREFEVLRQMLREAGDDGLDENARRMLRECDFEIAGIHFALEDYEQAAAAYSEAAHRYPSDPHVVLAYVQMSHCYAALERPVESRSMLEQARIVLRQMPDSAFQSRVTTLSRDEWERWIDRAARLRSPAGSEPTASRSDRNAAGGTP